MGCRRKDLFSHAIRFGPWACHGPALTATNYACLASNACCAPCCCGLHMYACSCMLAPLADYSGKYRSIDRSLHDMLCGPHAEQAAAVGPKRLQQQALLHGIVINSTFHSWFIVTIGSCHHSTHVAVYICRHTHNHAFIKIIARIHAFRQYHDRQHCLLCSSLSAVVITAVVLQHAGMARCYPVDQIPLIMYRISCRDPPWCSHRPL